MTVLVCFALQTKRVGLVAAAVVAWLPAVAGRTYATGLCEAGFDAADTCRALRGVMLAIA